MENMTINIAAATPVLVSGHRALLCATPATDLRTYDVRIDVRLGAVRQDAQILATDFGAVDVWAKRVRVTAPTTGMGHVGTARIEFAAGTVPGSPTWSPPI